MSATAYILEQGRIRRTPDGYVEDFVIHVEGISGPPSQRRANALRAADNEIPYGSAHPVLPDIYLLDQDAQELPGSTTKFRVFCTYRQRTSSERETLSAGEDYGPLSVSIDAGTTDETAYTDQFGSAMLVGYIGRYEYTYLNYTTKQVVVSSTQSTAFSKRLTPTVQRPVIIARLNRWERSSPLPIARQLVGRVNSAVWGGYSPKTWLCIGVRSSQREDGRYDVGYEFQYRESTWRYDGTVRVNNAVPPDAAPGNGIAFFDVYPTANPSAYGLSLT